MHSNVSSRLAERAKFRHTTPMFFSPPPPPQPLHPLRPVICTMGDGDGDLHQKSNKYKINIKAFPNKFLSKDTFLTNNLCDNFHKILINK